MCRWQAGHQADKNKGLRALGGNNENFPSKRIILACFIYSAYIAGRCHWPLRGNLDGHHGAIPWSSMLVTLWIYPHSLRPVVLLSSSAMPSQGQCGHGGDAHHACAYHDPYQAELLTLLGHCHCLLVCDVREWAWHTQAVPPLPVPHFANHCRVRCHLSQSTLWPWFHGATTLWCGEGCCVLAIHTTVNHNVGWCPRVLRRVSRI